MQLKEFLEKNSISVRAFAKSIGVTPTAVLAYSTHTYAPRLDVAIKIALASKGEVKVADQLPPEDLASIIEEFGNGDGVSV